MERFINRAPIVKYMENEEKRLEGMLKEIDDSIEQQRIENYKETVKKQIEKINQYISKQFSTANYEKPEDFKELAKKVDSFEEHIEKYFTDDPEAEIRENPYEGQLERKSKSQKAIRGTSRSTAHSSENKESQKYLEFPQKAYQNKVLTENTGISLAYEAVAVLNSYGEIANSKNVAEELKKEPKEVTGSLAYLNKRGLIRKKGQEKGLNQYEINLDFNFDRHKNTTNNKNSNEAVRNYLSPEFKNFYGPTVPDKDLSIAQILYEKGGQAKSREIYEKAKKEGLFNSHSIVCSKLTNLKKEGIVEKVDTGIYRLLDERRPEEMLWKNKGMLG